MHHLLARENNHRVQGKKSKFKAWTGMIAVGKCNSHEIWWFGTDLVLSKITPRQKISSQACLMKSYGYKSSPEMEISKWTTSFRWFWKVGPAFLGKTYLNYEWSVILNSTTWLKSTAFLVAIHSSWYSIKNAVGTTRVQRICKHFLSNISLCSHFLLNKICYPSPYIYAFSIKIHT